MFLFHGVEERRQYCFPFSYIYINFINFIIFIENIINILLCSDAFSMYFSATSTTSSGFPCPSALTAVLREQRDEVSHALRVCVNKLGEALAHALELRLDRVLSQRAVPRPGAQRGEARVRAYGRQRVAATEFA